MASRLPLSPPVAPPLSEEELSAREAIEEKKAEEEEEEGEEDDEEEEEEEKTPNPAPTVPGAAGKGIAKRSVSLLYAPPKPGVGYTTAAQYVTALQTAYPDVTFGLVKSFGNVSTHVTLEGADKDDHEIVKVQGSTAYDARMQACRWLAVMAQQYLANKRPGKPIAEVQAAFIDPPGSVWIASNDDSQTKLLLDGDWLTWGEGVDSTTLKTPDSVRKAKKIQNALTFSTKLAGEADFNGTTSCPHRKVPRLSPGAYTKEVYEAVGPGTAYDRMMEVLRPTEFVFPFLKVKGVGTRLKKAPVVHAESKILLIWRALRDPADTTPTTIVVAGVMRPCLCCFVRLSRHKQELAPLGVTLIHKDRRNGPFWPTQASLAAATPADHVRIMNHLKTYQPYYVSPPNTQSNKTGIDPDRDSDSEEEAPTLKNPHVALYDLIPYRAPLPSDLGVTIVPGTPIAPPNAKKRTRDQRKKEEKAQEGGVEEDSVEEEESEED